jgi:hypothetical protein
MAADCPAVDTTCVHPGNGGHQLCYFNDCGAGAVPANGTGFYLPCDSGGPLKGDALCIPRNDLTQPGRCEASGSAPIGSPCSLTRMNGSTTQVCEIGSKCFLGSSGLTRCLPLCAGDGVPATAPDGGPGCPTGDICFNEFTPWGYCVQPCSPTADGGGSCPTGTQCSVLAPATYGCVP